MTDTEVIDIPGKLDDLALQIEDLRHVVLCLTLQVLPPAGLAEELLAAGNCRAPYLKALATLGRLFATQQREIAHLSQLLMRQTAHAAGPDHARDMQILIDATNRAHERHESVTVAHEPLPAPAAFIESHPENNGFEE